MALLAVPILEHLLAHPRLAETLQFTQVQRFLEFTKRIWAEIVAKDQIVPTILPPHIRDFLVSVLILEPSLVELCWLAFSDLATTFQQDLSPASLDDGFRMHANEHCIGAESIMPPMEHCSRATCNHTRLGEERVVGIQALYTASRCSAGVLQIPLLSQRPTVRRVAGEYYTTEIPDLIHVTESSFAEPQLCSYFATQMAMSHASATSISRVYNLALGNSDIPNASRLSHQMDSDFVIEAFFLHAVLKDKYEQIRFCRCHTMASKVIDLTRHFRSEIIELWALGRKCGATFATDA
ncbi:hypothetical protein C8J57DRAFT_1617471 [Mycena rebaudengoi]|nr:hypothetical protein C8J57DRAFT_1617471 [Mycena rebaudengoi]